VTFVNTKRFTILHSNDMHGDFLAETQGASGKLMGGLPLLSGYINQVRREQANTLYVIAGDMLQGSVIDSEFRGTSTMEIMNYIRPDVVSLGNHEFDYGLPHLLFLEKVANFPIVNANLYLKEFNKRLMRPHLIIEKAGFSILFIGIITEKIMADIAKDQQIASFITLSEASAEVGRICNSYRNDDIDLTVLLTHIGFESDKELAAMLRPEWGVDMIIGGHSHTILDQPANINNILIAQAGVGTDQIGRFDIVVNDDTNSIVEWKWQLVPIGSDIAQPDQQLQDYIQQYKTTVDRKYASIVCRLADRITHPKREIETALGNLTADALMDVGRANLILMGSGFIRSAELGPMVTLGNFTTCFPFQESLTRCSLTGEQLTHIFNFIMRPQNRNGEGECYQVSRGVQATYSEREQRLESLTLNGEPIAAERTYTVCLPEYHFRNAKRFLDVSTEELSALTVPRTVTTSIPDTLDEFLRTHQGLSGAVEGRMVYRDGA
jgi:5'-nucleotidase/UDP-sugar diphosphatase